MLCTKNALCYVYTKNAECIYNIIIVKYGYIKIELFYVARRICIRAIPVYRGRYTRSAHFYINPLCTGERMHRRDVEQSAKRRKWKERKMCL